MPRAKIKHSFIVEVSFIHPHSEVEALEYIRAGLERGCLTISRKRLILKHQEVKPIPTPRRKK